MSDSHYIILDIETGGIGLDKSLLTAYFLVTDINFSTISDLYLYLKPNDGVYNITGESLGINKINLQEHDKVAISYQQGGTTLYQFLSTYTNKGKIKVIPVGHGLAFDLLHIWDKLISRNTWNMFVSYRTLDTSVSLQFLKASGLFPDDITGSLESLVNFFKIKTDKENGFHDAKFDTIMTKECLIKLIEHVKHHE